MFNDAFMKKWSKKKKCTVNHGAPYDNIRCDRTWTIAVFGLCRKKRQKKNNKPKTNKQENKQTNKTNNMQKKNKINKQTKTLTKIQ